MKKVETMESSTAHYRSLVVSRQARLQRLRGQVLNKRMGRGDGEDETESSGDIPPSVTAGRVAEIEMYGSIEEISEQVDVLRQSYS